MHISAHYVAPVAAAGNLDAAKLGFEDIQDHQLPQPVPVSDVVVERLRIDSQHVGDLLHGQGFGRYRARRGDYALTADTRRSATGTRCHDVAVKPGYIDCFAAHIHEPKRTSVGAPSDAVAQFDAVIAIEHLLHTLALGDHHGVGRQSVEQFRALHQPSTEASGVLAHQIAIGEVAVRKALSVKPVVHTWIV